MNNRTLITNFAFTSYKYHNIHSAGPEQYFNNPYIGYIKKGYVEFLYKGKTIRANEGDLVYIASGTKYHSIWFGSPEIEWYSIGFDFKHQYDFCEYPFQVLEKYPSALLEKIHDTYEKNYFLSVAYFYQLLDDIYPKLQSVSEHIKYTSADAAIEYIENNYNKDISVSTLAKLCKCSESGFFKMFKNSTGVTPVSYKQNVMIQHSLELLAHTNLSIEEISTRVGFSSSNYFRTVFFKLTGKTPKELR